MLVDTIKIPVAMNGILPSEMKAMIIGKITPSGIEVMLNPSNFPGSFECLLSPYLSILHTLYSVLQSCLDATIFLTASFTRIENTTISKILRKFLSQKLNWKED